MLESNKEEQEDPCLQIPELSKAAWACVTAGYEPSPRLRAFMVHMRRLCSGKHLQAVPLLSLLLWVTRPRPRSRSRCSRGVAGPPTPRRGHPGCPLCRPPPLPSPLADCPRAPSATQALPRPPALRPPPRAEVVAGAAGGLCPPPLLTAPGFSAPPRRALAPTHSARQILSLPASDGPSWYHASFPAHRR